MHLPCVAGSTGEDTELNLEQNSTGTVVADAVKLVRDNSADTDNEKKTFTYAYDVNGNLTSIDDTSSGARIDAYTVAYTGLNQVQKVTESLSGTEKKATSYTYDANGQPETVTHPTQHSAYTYDLRELVKTVSVGKTATDTDPKVTSYTYTDRGQKLKETKANDNTVDYAYYLDGALKSTVEKKADGTTLVASHTYAYDPNGNKAQDVAKKMNADHTAYLESTTDHTYDPASRLTKSVKTGNGAGTEEYVHDDNANVVSQTVKGTSTTYHYDRNRLLSATADGVTANYNYDPFGRQESVTSGGKVIERSVYDGFDHVVESQKTDDAGAMKSTTYTFDPLDRTASKTADGKTTDFEYLGLSGEVLDEKVAGKLTKSYQYSPWGERLSQIKHNTDGTTEDGYYGYNSHTDVETLTDSSGNTKATYGYTAYGSEDESEFTGIDKPDANDPTKETYNPYRYNAKRWDAQSGTYDMGFRDYNPGLNRFTTRDMYNGALADMNLGVDPYTGNRYAFTGGNPTSFVEFDGHFSITDIAKDVLKFAGKRNPVGLVSSVSGLLFDFDPVGDAVDTVVGEIFGETESRWYQAKDYDKGRFLTPDGEVETDPGIGSGDLPPSCLNGGQTWVFYQPLDDQGRATGMHACLNKGDFNSSKDNGEAAFPDNDATAIWGSKAPWPVEDWGDNPKGIKSGMHRGHLLARQLGGDGEDRRNLVPLYARVNTPEMRDIETEIAERIQGNETILYSVIPDCGSGGNVPTSLTLTAVGNKGYRLNYPLINQP